MKLLRLSCEAHSDLIGSTGISGAVSVREAHSMKEYCEAACRLGYLLLGRLNNNAASQA